MEGDFYKCEEVAFSEDVSSRLAKAALITQADSTRQMEFFYAIQRPNGTTSN